MNIIQLFFISVWNFQLWSYRFVHSNNFFIQIEYFIFFCFQYICAHSHNLFQNIDFLIFLFQFNLQVFNCDLGELPDFHICLQKSFFQVCHLFVYLSNFISLNLILILLLLNCKILIINLLILKRLIFGLFFQ